jgi:hypothetical protein
MKTLSDDDAGGYGCLSGWIYSCFFIICPVPVYLTAKTRGKAEITAFQWLQQAIVFPLQN